MNCAVTGETTEPGQYVLQRRIGSTLYRTRAHFSTTSRETLDDKILRLLKNDLNLVQGHGNMEVLQTEDGCLEGVPYEQAI